MSICKCCKKKYEKSRPMQVVCGLDCALIYSKVTAKKKEKKEIKIKKDALKPLSYYVKKAEKVCNEYIRLRDANSPCISCNAVNAKKWDAGHYISVGANRSLRFNELNIHKQCSFNCNVNLSGNLINYRKGLLKKIGEEKLSWLEGWHEPEKMTKEKAMAVEKYFKEKLNNLKKGNHG